MGFRKKFSDLYESVSHYMKRLAFRMAKFSNVEIEPAGYISKEANEPAYKCKRAANAQMHKLAQIFAISSGDRGPTWKITRLPIQYRFDYDS